LKRVFRRTPEKHQWRLGILQQKSDRAAVHGRWTQKYRAISAIVPIQGPAGKRAGRNPLIIND